MGSLPSAEVSARCRRRGLPTDHDKRKHRISCYSIQFDPNPLELRYRTVVVAAGSACNARGVPTPIVGRSGDVCTGARRRRPDLGVPLGELTAVQRTH